MFPGELLSFVLVTTVTLWLMNVRHLDPEKCKPSKNQSLSATTRATRPRQDYTLFGKGAVLHVAVILCG